MAYLLACLDAVVLIGGLDYSPALYGQEPHESIKLIDPQREEFDIRLAQAVLTRTDLPLLGICGGCQLMNIAQGGTLIQDIKAARPESAVVHAKPDGWKHGFPKHAVSLETGSSLREIYGHERIEVPTSHHQAIDRLGKDLQVVSRAEDGIIEAVELPGRIFTIGVQWHPERDLKGNQTLLAEFVRQAARGKQAGREKR